ncbi:Protein kinase DC2 [Diplonema papillatum]|nr:Protein kinase DC2 [Diplonema papillatum]
MGDAALFEHLQLSDLELKETLGVGTFGRVRLAKTKKGNQYFALKILKKQEIIRMKQVDHILAEANILSDIHHPFIVDLHMRFMDENKLYFLLEFVPGGELFTHHRKSGKFPNDVSRFYSAEVLLAFEYLHSKDIIYRDLKPENLLLDVQGHVKICDFGFSKKVPERTHTLCGTPEYLAPEIIQSLGHGKAVDWWSLGILLYEMLVGYPPFHDESPFRIYEKVLDGKAQFPKWIDSRAKDIIKQLLIRDPTKRLGSRRLGVQDIKQHKYFYGIDWDVLLSKKIPAPIPVRVGRYGYFDKYPDSPEGQVKALTTTQQEYFKTFC